MEITAVEIVVLIYSNYDGKGGSEEIKEYKIKYGEKLTFEELFSL